MRLTWYQVLRIRFSIWRERIFHTEPGRQRYRGIPFDYVDKNGIGRRYGDFI